jgi:hypothetical protein
MRSQSTRADRAGKSVRDQEEAPLNAIVERLASPRKVKPPAELRMAELKREVRALKKELKDERRHSGDMLAIMRDMAFSSGRMTGLVDGCQCSQCTCTPTRAEMLRRA